MTYNEVVALINDNMYADHSGSLHGTEVVAQKIFICITRLQWELDELKKEILDMRMSTFEDRMGGQFTSEELSRGDGW